MKISFAEKENRQPLGDLSAGVCFMHDNITFIKTHRFDESGSYSLCVNLADGIMEAININALVTILDAELVVY